jgi:hypothetical protein
MERCGVDAEQLFFHGQRAENQTIHRQVKQRIIDVVEGENEEVLFWLHDSSSWLEANEVRNENSGK